MRFVDFISLTLENTSGNLLRTSLSIISVVIGVFSFVFVVSLNEGMAEQMMNTIKQFGGYNTFNIRTSKQNVFTTPIPGSKTKRNISFRYPITLPMLDSLNKHFKDNIFITELIGVEFVKIDKKRYRLIGITEKLFSVYENLKINKGRNFSLLDMKSKNNVAIISKENEEKHAESYSVGDFININNYEFEVVGEYTAHGFSLYGNCVIIPITTYAELFSGPDVISKSILCQVEDISKLKATIEQVKSYLDLFSEKGMFVVESREETIKEYEDMSSAYSNLILLFSILMLITGGIGIMNIMLSSIKEQLREIGIKKAVGAKNRDIFIQFFMETMFLFFIGGSIGIILAVFSVESAAEFIIKKQLWGEQAKAIITFKVIITSIIFTGIIGLIFGLFPAIKASKVMPIDSLRYE